MSIYIKDAGSWRLLPSNTYMYDNPPLKIKVGGTWTPVFKSYIKDNTGAWQQTYQSPTTHYFSAAGSGTVYVPRGITYMEVAVWGAGGGGGAGFDNGGTTYNGGAGGVGGYVRLNALGMISADWTAAVSYTVGAGGTGGTTGGNNSAGYNGGTSTVSFTSAVYGLVTFTANGGTAGLGNTNPNGGTGGSASSSAGGYYAVTGANGADGYSSQAATIYPGGSPTVDNYYSQYLTKGNGGAGKTAANGLGGEDGGVLIIFR